jgi:hypothetical protein
MDQAYTSDEPTGRKLIAVASDQGQENPCSISDDINDTPSTNQVKQRQTSSERSPLIRPRRSTDLTEDTLSRDNSDSGVSRVRYGSIPSRHTPPIEIRNNSGLLEKIKKTLSQPTNSVMSLLLIIVIDVVLVFAANISTDRKGLQVKPQHVLVYLMILISIFVAWTCIAVIPQKLRYSSRHDGTLIPSHLLTGVGIFGTFTATSHILLFLDFIKCSEQVNGLSYVYAVYPLFKIAFVYCQMYFFYKLSRDGIRTPRNKPSVVLPGGVFFVMVTLATNLCIWASVFFNDATSNPKLREISWLNHYYYGVEKHDLCANESLTSPGARELHALVGSFSPYISTFSMEYALLASGLLLHIWMVIKSPIRKVPKSRNQPWTLWRVGFIIGLLAIPVVFVAYMKEQTTLKLVAPKVTLYVLKACFFVALMPLCWNCIRLVSEKSGFVKKKKPMKLEIILLGISAFLGFPAFDLASAFAAVCEWRNFPILMVIWYAITYMCELFSISLQFFFIKKAYQYKLPKVAGEKVKKAAMFIRQYASFALVISIAYWAAKTYELRRTSDDPSIAEKFFGKYTWFALSHFSLPLCVFFYFHLAICYANVVFSFSQFGPLWSRNELEVDK